MIVQSCISQFFYQTKGKVVLMNLNCALNRSIEAEPEQPVQTPLID